MGRIRIEGERGQSLVVIAVAMTVLLIFSAFAVDLAFWYLERRQMQNSADAGALAGARTLGMCVPDPEASLTEGQLYGIILHWAQQNGAQTVQAFFIRENGSKYPINAGSGAPVPKKWADAKGVRVVASANFPTFFSSILGRNQMNADAAAESEWGGAGTSEALVPLAIRDLPWNTSGNPFYLLMQENKYAPPDWGWLSLNCKSYDIKNANCSASSAQLVDWVINGYDGQLPTNTAYKADPGLKVNVSKQFVVGEVAIVPMFDQIFLFTDKDLDEKNGTPLCVVDGNGDPVQGQYAGYMDTFDEDGNLLKVWNHESYCATECSKSYGMWCAHTDDSRLTNQYYFHITKFAAVRITSVSKSGQEIEGEFIDYVTLGDRVPYYMETGLIVVALTE